MPICDTQSDVDIGATRPSASMCPAEAGRRWNAAGRCRSAAVRAVAVAPVRAVAPTASSAAARSALERRGPAVAGCMPKETPRRDGSRHDRPGDPYPIGTGGDRP